MCNGLRNFSQWYLIFQRLTFCQFETFFVMMFFFYYYQYLIYKGFSLNAIENYVLQQPFWDYRSFQAKRDSIQNF